MSHPGPDGNPSGQQPDEPAQPYGRQPGRPGPYEPVGHLGQPPQPAGAWVPPQGGAGPAGPPQRKGGGGRKVLLSIVGLVVAVVIASVAAFALLGGGDPEIGDCVHYVGAEEIEVVDCGSAEAELEIVGVDAQELDYQQFLDETVCAEYANATSAVWVGADQDEPGTIYCAEPV